MTESANQYRVLSISISSMFIIVFLMSSVIAQSDYHETISVLQTRHMEEIQTVHYYLAYARKAKLDYYPNIAKLFISLAASESIHAKNLKEVSSTLGVEVKELPKLDVEVSSTKKNLKRAAMLELEEVDKKYPQYLKRLKPDNHAEAIRYVTYAWESEKQHRQLLQKIRSGTGMFFGLLKKEIEENPIQFFVCQNCGSTQTDLPKLSCPICGESASKYCAINE